MEFNNRLKLLRKENGYTQEELAKKLGISAGAVGLYEQNRREPDNDTLVSLASIFNVSIDYLLGLESKTPPSPILMDDFTYALYNETKELTDKQKQAILDMAKAFTDSQK